MERKDFLKIMALVSALPTAAGSRILRKLKIDTTDFLNRVRPGDPLWPSQTSWDRLKQEVQGRLIDIESPLKMCEIKPHGEACEEVLSKLKNPYYISNQPALTQTSGWVDAWISEPSVYAIEAEKTADVVAGVNFARKHNLRLGVKGGAHSYQGRSCSEDSLLIWTKRMNDVNLHDTFVPQDCTGTITPQPAVSIGAGAIWMDAYSAVTTEGGRYVQGGGCTTVGVGGLIQSGGFGNFSKKYGLAASGLLEAEVVTADGEVRIANACTNSDLFWALKGGGGGSFGVVTKLTLKTHELPQYFGGAFGAIKAKSDFAFRDLIAQTMNFYHDQLFNPHWGESIDFGADNSISIQMVFQGLSQKKASEIWQPFIDWVTERPQKFTFENPIRIAALPAQHFWDAEYLKQNIPQLITPDNRPEAAADDFFWTGDQGQAAWFIHGYRSAWLPESLLKKRSLVDALFAASRWSVSLHFNKGLAGAPTEERKAARNTAMNPEITNAFALAIIAGGGPPAFPDISGHEPDVKAAVHAANAIDDAMNELLQVAPNAGSYVSESDFFEDDWQQSFWGSNYSKLLKVKEKYDPDGLFIVHHGVGSENWSDDGFIRFIDVDPAILDDYVGKYQLSPDFVITITREFDQLFVEAPDQPKVRLLPETEKEFYPESEEFRIIFVRDSKGNVTQLIVHSDGQDLKASRL